jgi:phage terminase Nu1 subunit (DNA packaging protein)
MVKLPIMLQETKLPKTVSTAQLAALFGVSAKTVSSWQKAGTVVRVKYGRYDLSRSVRAVIERKRGAETTVATAVGSERARVLKLQGDRLEQQMKVEAGELVSLAEATAVEISILRNLRSVLLALPARVGGMIALSRDAIEVIREEIRSALTEVAKGSNYPAELVEVAEKAVEAALAKGRR